MIELAMTAFLISAAVSVFVFAVVRVVEVLR